MRRCDDRILPEAPGVRLLVAVRRVGNPGEPRNDSRSQGKTGQALTTIDRLSTSLLEIERERDVLIAERAQWSVKLEQERDDLKRTVARLQSEWNGAQSVIRQRGDSLTRLEQERDALTRERDEQADTIDQLSVQYTDALVERDAAQEALIRINNAYIVAGASNEACVTIARKALGLNTFSPTLIREQPPDTAEGDFSVE